MNTDDKESALVRTPSTALARTGSQALARRGLRDLQVAEQKPNQGDGCAEDQAQFLFCLDHWCTHDKCPNVPHVDFSLVSAKDIHLEVLQRSTQEGQSGREYYVIQTATEWEVVEDNSVAWEPEPHPDGTTWLKVPEHLRGKVVGPFFTMSEAQQSADERTRGGNEQNVSLPRIIPHLWTGPEDVAHGWPPGCSFCGESDPAQYGKPCRKRSCYTWYEVLGLSDSANQEQVEDAYRELTKKWNLKRLCYRDDIRYDWGYSETQLKWFDAAYAVLSSATAREQYDIELRKKQR